MPLVAAPFTPLQIQSGQDWSVPITVYSGGVLVEVDQPVLQMRRDLNPAGQLLASLDTTGTADGSLTRISIGQWTANLSWQFTDSMPSGRGFWQMVGYVAGRRVLVASGVLEIEVGLVANAESALHNATVLDNHDGTFTIIMTEAGQRFDSQTGLLSLP